MLGVPISTADLYDQHGPELEVLDLPLANLGGRPRFSGPIATAQVFEDNSHVKTMLAEPGAGRVLVIDGAGSLRFALVGDQIARRAVEQGWAGVVVFGAVRDAAVLKTLDLGVRALGTSPRRTEKRGQGLIDVPIRFGGARFSPGAWLYADEDGVVVAPRDLG